MSINIDDLLSCKYKKGGRSKKEGYDCYGYLIEVEKRFGHKIPDFADLKKTDIDYIHCMNMAEKEASDITSVEKPEYESDVILFKGDNGVCNHVGIYLGNGLFTHCNIYGPHVERLNTYYRKIGKVYSWHK